MSTDPSARSDGLTRADIGWLRHRSRTYVTNLVRNLRVAAERHEPALRPAEGKLKSAIIVGAGPSLEKNRHLLKQAQDAGWTILCVNASLPAIIEHVEPDYCFAREMVAVHLGLPEMPSRTKLIADVGSHAAVFDRSYAWFLGAQPRTYEICAELGVRPIYAGSAALTTAVSVALEAGATRIALVGTDLAFARGGQGYASSSQWEGLNLTEAGEDSRFAESALRTHRGICAAVGLQPSLQENTQTELVPAWDGGEPLRAISAWTDQATWLEDVAKRWSKVDWIAATEGGRALTGWRQDTLANVLEMPPTDLGMRIRLYPPQREDFDRLIQGLIASCDRLERIAHEVLEPTGDGFGAIDGFHLGAQLVEVWAQRDYIDAEGLPVKEQLECYEAARISAARAMRAMLEAKT